jgi:competence protein ComEA
VPHIIGDVFGPPALRDFLLLACAALALLVVCAVATSAKKTPPTEPVDLNVATVKELEDLPGIGPTTAKAIVDFRTKSGRIRRVNDLLVIRGISEAKLAKIRPYVTVGPPPVKTPPTKPTPPPSKTTTSPAKTNPPAAKTTAPTAKTTAPAPRANAPAAKPTPPSTPPPSTSPNPAATPTSNP